MLVYYYQARDRAGQIISGSVEAPNEKIATDTLQDRGFEIIVLKETRRRYFSLSFLERVAVKDFVIFSRQLATLIGAKIPLVQSLQTVARQTANKKLQTVLKDVTENVESGSKLSAALARYPKVFDNFFINMIKSGETSGRLDETLTYLANQKEKDYDLMSKIKSAMIYPAFIIVSMFAVMVVLMVFVIPQLTAVLQESGAKLPFSTRLLIGSSGFMTNYWWLLLIFVTMLIFTWRYALRDQKVRFAWDYLKLRLPIVGPILQKIDLVRFFRSFETLVIGGVDIVDSLKVTSQVVQNLVYQDLIKRTVKEVEDGNSITAVFADSKLIPTMVNQMLGVGEETGRLTEILRRLTDFYTREIDNSVSNLVSVIEPVIMIVIGIGVGLIVSAIILPMYQLASAF